MFRDVHIILFSEAINRDACFFDEKDYAFYLQQLKISAEQCGVAIHAFVLMTNHVHLPGTPAAANSCAKMMQSLGRKYVQYRKLFADVIPMDTLDQIRECTNKSWVLGSSKFKAQIESAANRRIDSLSRGGDRKSKRVIDQGVCRTNTSCRCVLRLSDSIVIPHFSGLITYNFRFILSIYPV